MTPQNRYNNYIYLISIFALLSVLIFGYITYNKEIEELKSKLATYDGNQQKVETEFAKINDEYHSMMASLSEKDLLLIQNQSDLQDIKKELEGVLGKQKKSESDLVEAKALIEKLKTKINFNNQLEEVQKEITELENKNNKNLLEIKRYQELLSQKDLMLAGFQKDIKQKQEIIKKGATLRLINFDLKGVNVKANGKEVETDKARKADKLRVSFQVNDNNISDSGDKELFLSLYDANDKLAHFPEAKSGTITLQNGNIQEYTDFVTFNYQKGQPQEIKFDWENDDFQKGEYTIKVFENGNLIGSQSISFR